MLGFLRLGSMVGALAGGFALLGVFGGCGPSAGTCSADFHTVIGPDGNPAATCGPDEACSTDGINAACRTCDPTQCLPKNDCILGWARLEDALKGDTSTQTTECRLACTGPADCPFNYTCIAGGNGTNYCAKDRTPSYLSGDIQPAAAGEAAGGSPWGDPCDPLKGLGSNPDCDTNQSFWCYGKSPTDANAFCTQFQCADDADCPGGWWCATINDTPNVSASTRTDRGTTTTVCLPRIYDKPGTYCAPCTSDADCPFNGQTPQHCVSADNNGGAEMVCATECQTNDNCPLDEKCADAGVGNNVCVPRAQTCKGDGSFCSPCHSDADCTSSAGQGFCISADYSTEHFCTAPTTSCTGATLVDPNIEAAWQFDNTSCPAVPDGPPNTTTDGVGCGAFTFNGNKTYQCLGYGAFGLSCHTYHCASKGGSCVQSSDCCTGACIVTDCPAADYGVSTSSGSVKVGACGEQPTCE